MNLELIKEGDAQELFDLTEMNRANLRKWLPWVDHVKIVSDTEKFIATSITAYQSKTTMTFTIRDAGELVGVCGFNKFDWETKVGEIGYWLGEGFQGRGLMTKACTRLEEMAFKELGLEAIHLLIAEFNRPSRALAERLSYTEVNKIPEAEWLYDHHVDYILYEKKTTISN